MKTLTAALLLAGCALAQNAPTAPTVGKIYDNQLRNIESEVVGLVEAMPADKIDFAPPASAGEFKGVRTFALQAKHLAAVLYMVSASAANDPKPPVDLGQGENGPATVKTKDQIVKFVKDAFAYTHSAVNSLTAENQLQMVKSPFGDGQMARGAAAMIALWHSMDHYGQMVEYARMNRVIPPASR